MPQDPKLAQRPLGERDVLKRVLYLLDRCVVFCVLVLRGAHDAVCTLTDRFQHRVPLRDFEFGPVDHVATRGPYSHSTSRGIATLKL